MFLLLDSIYVRHHVGATSFMVVVQKWPQVLKQVPFVRLCTLLYVYTCTCTL